MIVCNHGRRGLVLFADGRVEVVQGKQRMQELLSTEVMTVTPQQSVPSAHPGRGDTAPAVDNSALLEWIKELEELREFVASEVAADHVRINPSDIASAQAGASATIAEFFYDFFVGGAQNTSGIRLPDIMELRNMTQLEQVALFKEAQSRLDKYLEEIAASDCYQETIALVKQAQHEIQTTQYALAREHFRQAATGFLKAYAIMDAIDPEKWGATKNVDGNTWWTVLWDKILPLYADIQKEGGYHLTKYLKLESEEVRPILTKEYCNLLRSSAEQAFQDFETQKANDFQNNAPTEAMDAPEALLLRVRQKIVRLEVVELGSAADLQKRIDETEHDFLLGCCAQARANRDWLMLRQFGRSLCTAEPELNRPVLDEEAGRLAIEEGEREYRTETLEALENARARRQWELACEKATALQEVAPDLGQKLLEELRRQWAAELVAECEKMNDLGKLAVTLVKVLNLDPENAHAWELEARVVAELGDDFTAKVILDDREVPATLSFDEASAQWAPDMAVPGFCWGDKFQLAARYSENGVNYEANVRFNSNAVGPGEVQTLTLKVGAFFVTLPDGSRMRLEQITSGKFQMGSEWNAADHFRDEPLHQVTLTDDFWLGQYEVTQAQWGAVMGYNPSDAGTYNDCPVDSISWDEAKEFCEKLNNDSNIQRPAGYIFDLPTEAQWEYACRAGTASALNNGQELRFYRGRDEQMDALGWYQGNSLGRTWPVGQKEPNAWGLYDMHGNVWEMCRDKARLANGYTWSNVCDTISRTNPVGTDGDRHVIRGGSWINEPMKCRSAYRASIDANGANGVGFRLALVKR